MATLYSYKPVLMTHDNYLLGNSTYFKNFCWPGYSPFYSYFYQYPKNFMYAVQQIIKKISELFPATTAPAPDYEYQPHSVSAISYHEIMTMLFHVFRDGLDYNFNASNG